MNSERSMEQKWVKILECLSIEKYKYKRYNIFYQLTSLGMSEVDAV